MQQRQTEYTGKVNITAAVPVALGEAFDKYAQSKGLSKSRVLRGLMVQALKAEGLWPLPKPPVKRKVAKRTG